MRNQGQRNLLDLLLEDLMENIDAVDEPALATAVIK